MEPCVERRSQQRRLGVRLNDESVVALLACSPSCPATLRSPALNTMTDDPALKIVVDHQEVSGLWLWHGARPGENERQRAFQSWATVTSVRKAFAGERSHLAEEAPNGGSEASQPPGIRGMAVYTRSVRSGLSGHASVGFVNSVNAPTVAPAVSTPSFDAVAAQIDLNYVLGPTLKNNGAVLASGRASDVTVNQFQFLSSKTV